MSAEQARLELDEESAVAPVPIRRGRKLGRYILCYELASGGMATVYLARAPGIAGFEKLVALKLIHPHLAKEKRFVDMFLDEARIAARIDHPNVCGVFDFGEADGTYYLAMEYLLGETLARLARGIARADEGTLNEERLPALIAYIVQQACEGLHAAHELRDRNGELADLVHRDVTPQNLFLGFDGSVRVVDFGVASATGRTHQTTTGTLKGKFAYMSPEQLNRKSLDRRSDIFSLGVCLWELLTRRRLFKRVNEFETLKAVVEGRIPPPSSFRPGVPPELDVIALRALEREPDERYSTARQLGQDLGSFVASQGGASAADVADLMATLFPEGRSERRELIDKARAVDPETPSTSRIVPAPGLIDSGSSMPAGTLVLRRRTRWIIALSILFAMVGVGSVIAFRQTQDTVAVIPLGPAGSQSGAPEGPPPEVEGPPPEVEVTPPEGTATEVLDPAADDPGLEPDAGEAVEPEDPDPDPEPDAPVARPIVMRPASMRPRMSETPMETVAAMEAQPSGEGRVNVVTPPGWADIFVDGRNRGRSPTELTLPAGSHRVRLVPYGDGEPITRSVTVEDGQTERLVVRLPD